MINLEIGIFINLTYMTFGSFVAQPKPVMIFRIEQKRKILDLIQNISEWNKSVTFNIICTLFFNTRDSLLDISIHLC